MEIKQEFVKKFTTISVLTYLAINDSFLIDKVIHHLPQYQPQPQYQPPTVIQPIVQPPTMIQPQFAPQPIVQQMPQISQIPQMPFHGFQNLSNHQMGQINPYLPYQPTRLPHGGKQPKPKTQPQIKNSDPMTMAQSGLVRSESRRRLPDPPTGVEPVTVQPQFCQNESIQLEQRMQGMFYVM